jgi:sporulation protein YlmC with PRC-barrel domain
MIMEPTHEELFSLERSHVTVSDAPEDIRGRKVFDKDSTEIGKVNDLFVDTRQMKVRFLEVSSNGVPGVADTVLLPVDAITVIDKDRVFLGLTTQTLAGAPKYDSNVTDHNFLSSLYDYYGYSPYWRAGYVYPSYPHYARRPGRPRKQKTA